jgi:hypothetical protein
MALDVLVTCWDWGFFMSHLCKCIRKYMRFEKRAYYSAICNACFTSEAYIHHHPVKTLT